MPILAGQGQDSPTGTAEVTAPAATVAVREGTVVTRPARRKPQPIDGALLFELTRRYLCHYFAFRKPSDADLVAAWVLHAVARKRGDTGMGQLIWRASPRLLILSRKRGAGKSTLLDLIAFLTGSTRGKVPRITPARLAQITGQAYETVLIDEGRLVFGAGARHEDLQACLLVGYTPGSSYEVSKTSLSLFGAVAIASKESLITEATKAVDGESSSLGDLLDRCIKVIAPASAVPMPEVGEQAAEDGALLNRAMVAWTNAMSDDLRQAAADIAAEDLEAARERARRGESESKTPRAAQIARPLRAIGRVIGPEAEQDIADALRGTDEASEIMTELQGRSWAGGEDDEPEAGQITYAPERDDGLLADLAASLPEPAPARAGSDHPPAPAGAAPGAVWAAVRVTAASGNPPAAELIGDQHADMTAAMAACQADTGEPLPWIEGARPGSWTATIRPGPGVEVSYAVSAAE